MKIREHTLLTLAAIAVLAASSSMHVQAAFFSTTQSFEGFPPNAPLDGNGWSSVGVIVTNQAGIGFNDSFAAAYFGELAVASNTINETSFSPTRVWTDFQIKPAMGRGNKLVPYIPDDALVLVQFDDEGYILYFDNTKQWTRITHDIFGTSVDPVPDNAWQRISLFQDFSTETYAILLNGVVVAQDIPFIHAGSGYQSFTMKNPDNEALLDDIRIDNSLPGGLTSNLNHYALADATELDMYGYVARTFTVDTGAADNPPLQFQQLSEAIAISRPNDQIDLQNANYSALTITKDITFVGSNITVPSITVENGATLTLMQDVIVSGDITVASGANLIAHGTLQANNLDSSGSLVANGVLTVDNLLSVSGTLTLAADATANQANVSGTINILDDTLTITSLLDLTGSGSIQIAADGTLNADSITMAGGTQIASTGGTLITPALTLPGTFTIHGSTWEAWDKSSVLAQTLPYAEDFDSFANGQSMANLAIFGWDTAYLDVAVTDAGPAASGAQSVILPDGTELALHVDGALHTRVWTDFFLRPALGPGPPDPIAYSAAGNGFASYVDHEGNLNALILDNSVPTWLPLASAASWDDEEEELLFDVPFESQFSSAGFTRVSIYQNFENNTFSVYVGATNLVAVAQPFPGGPLASYSHYIIKNTGETDTEAYLDDILITATLPAFVGDEMIDINDNGMDDREEIHWFGNLTTYTGVRGSVFRFR